GLLVYSTCTISAAENERNLEGLLASHPELTLHDLGTRRPALRLARSLRAPRNRELAQAALRTLPSRDGTAGFFVAALRRGGARRAEPVRSAGPGAVMADDHGS
ncbi:MAG: hypothetical protein KGJ43_10205, partial [Acidobacteriota bacterium]|nr:hypothetical protein [Acidobacteriota bacterium]